MQDPTFVQKAFSDIAPRYVLANHVLSGGIDWFWRRLVASRVQAAHPKRVLDVATGSGDLAAAVQKACPEALVIGADFCAPMMVHAQQRGLKHLIVADGMNLPFPEASFDCLTVGFGLRNMADYPAAVTEFARVLRPGGRLFILDFSHPPGLLRPIYEWYLHRVLPLIAGWLTGHRGAYDYLGGSIQTFPSGEVMRDLVRGQGFTTCDWHPLTFGIASLYEAERAL
jgi:demethylmenaquinone methyltransferase / 2-methoxy-6-polyprenyl-1,4-benzoquinol methylase